MLIGLKYCGGCNPRYDRVAYATAYEKAHPGDRMVLAEEGEKYDKLLVICGCPSACASIAAYEADQVEIVTSNND